MVTTKQASIPRGWLILFKRHSAFTCTLFEKCIGMYVCCRFSKNVNQITGYLYDFCDGEIFQNHPLFSVDNQALQIIIYTDEVETANPLGSYRGVHKLDENNNINYYTA